MITGTSNWNAALACASELPIACTLEFPAFGIVISSFDPKQYPSLGMPAGTIGRMVLPDGPNQNVDELSGASEISGFEIECNDPTNILKPLVASSGFIGTVALFKLGFLPIPYTIPGLDNFSYADFNLMHTMQVMKPAWTNDGKIRFDLQDPLRYHIYQIFNSGGPTFWAPSLATPPQPAGPTAAINGQPISSDNPLWLQGNPLDIYLAVLQNFVGLGQTPNIPQSEWSFYDPPDTTTLINPNPYVDVTGILALRNQYFSGDWMEFKLSDATTAKDWLETQILKPLGLYSIVRSTGQISLKQMKSAASLYPPAFQLFNSQIIGIPSMDREPPLNVMRGRLNVNKASSEDNRAGKQFNGTWVWWDQASISEYQQQFIHECESQGLITPRGGFMRLGLLAQRVFSRHGFGTPVYECEASGGFLGVEDGDIGTLTHQNMMDFETGLAGLNNCPVEVIDRKPNYSKGTITLKLLDCRFLNETAPATGVRTFAPISTPAWNAATVTQQNDFFFISDSSGLYEPGGVPGDPIY